eukprot:2540273-Rhodomonas_salina.1
MGGIGPENGKSSEGRGLVVCVVSDYTAYAPRSLRADEGVWQSEKVSEGPGPGEKARSNAICPHTCSGCAMSCPEQVCLGSGCKHCAAHLHARGQHDQQHVPGQPWSATASALCYVLCGPDLAAACGASRTSGRSWTCSRSSLLCADAHAMLCPVLAARIIGRCLHQVLARQSASAAPRFGNQCLRACYSMHCPGLTLPVSLSVVTGM